MAGISSQISLMQNANWMTQQSPLDSIIKAKCGWRENRRNGKWRKENKEENDVFPCLVQERKHKCWKMLKKKIHPGSQIFFLLIWEENWEEKREKWGLALELNIYLIDVLYVSFFSFLFYYGNLRACDLWVRSLTPCLFFHFVPFFFFFNSFHLCS